jgi:hypothetical protein
VVHQRVFAARTTELDRLVLRVRPALEPTMCRTMIVTGIRVMISGRIAN